MSENTAGQVYKKNIGSVVIVVTGASGPRGSGVVIGDNEIVTNCHVVDDGSPVLVQQPGEGGMPPKRSPARIIASFSGDLCLLKTEGLSAPQAEIGESKSLSIGDSVYAIGNPNGIYGTLSSGIVSQVHPNDIQTTTALAGGSSGGGLFNHEGQLVGITTGSMGAGESTHSARRAELIGHLQQRVQVEAPLHDGLIAALNDPSADKFRELARRIAESIDHPQAQSLAWRNIGVQETERGDRDLAEPIVEKIRALAEAHPEFRDHIMVDAIHILANRGGKGDAEYLKSAQELAGQLGDENCQVQAVAHIVREVARNNIEHARKLCKNFPLDKMAGAADPEIRSEMASTCAAMEDSEKALRIAKGIPGLMAFTETLARIAYELEKQKVSVGSAAIFRFAMEWAINPESVNANGPVTISERLKALAVIGYHAANCGAYAESERALRMMVDYRNKCGNDGGYADELFRRGLVAEARALCGDAMGALRMMSRIPVLGNEIIPALTISAIKLSQMKQ